MALVVYDRVQETTATTGTGSITLGGAVDGFQSFAIVGNGNTTYYCIVNGTQWEVGLGTYSTSGPTLARTTVYSNSNGNTSPITLSGASNVFLTYPSERSVNLDATGNVTALGTVTSGVWNGTTVPVAYGGTGVTASSGANSVMLRDANQNVSINRLNQSNTSVSAAGGTTILTAASSYSQTLTGTGSQTFKMPDATTLSTGVAFGFNNNATGTLTIQDYATGSVGIVTSGGAVELVLLDNSTVAGIWDYHGYIPENVSWGTNALALGSTVITGGTWNGGTIQSGYGGTGLTTFTAANNALYSTSSSALAAGTLPVAAGGTAKTSFTANQVLYGSLSQSANLYFDGTNLGVGATSPTERVQISNSAASSNAIAQFTNGTTGTGGGNGFYVGVDSLNDATLYNFYNSNIKFATNGTERMRITAAGDLLLNTSTTGGKITSVASSGQIVAGNFSGASGQYTLALSIAGGNNMYLATVSNTNESLRFINSGGGELVRITSAGNLGVGTNSPNAKLEVNGAIRSSRPENVSYYTELVTNYSDVSTLQLNLLGNVILQAGLTNDTNLYTSGSTSNMKFYTNGSERMRLSSTGNFALGTTTTTEAKARFQLDSPGALGTVVNVASFGTNGIFSLGGATANTDGVYLGTGGSGGFGVASGFGFLREASGWDSAIAFYTNNITSGPNGTSAIQEKMRLTSTGALSFGSSGTNYGSSGQLLQSNGNASPSWVNQSSITAGSASNVAGLVANTFSSYTNIASTTAKTGFYGMLCGTGSNYPALMFDGSGGGIYKENTGFWALYYSYGNSCVGIGNSGTTAGYVLQVNGNAYATGSIVAAGNVTADSFVDSNSAYYLNLNGVSNFGTVITGTAQFQSNLGGYSGTLSNPPLQAYSTSNNSAFMSFHKGGYYAVNMGLDVDNVLRIGGWSAPANLWQLDTSGNSYNLASSRATVFYDVNDTSYYGDFAGNSILATATFNVNGSSIIYLTSAGTNASMIKAGAGDELYIGGNDTWQMRFTGGNAVMDNGGYFLNNTSVRAPYFYDSNNTAYYGDFAGRSYLYTFTMADSNEINQLTTNVTTSSIIGLGFNGSDSSYAIFKSAGAWVQPLNIKFYTGVRLYAAYNYDYGISFWDQVGGGLLMSVGQGDYNVRVSNDIRAQLYYDLNDTTYYADFASTSDSAVRQRGGTLHGPNVTWGVNLLVGGDGRQNYTNSATPSVCATNGNIHIDAGSGYDTLINYYDGEVLSVGRGTSSGFAMKVFGASLYTEIYGSARSPIFYDLDNSAYYADLNNTSKLNNLVINSVYTGNKYTGNGLSVTTVFQDVPDFSIAGVYIPTGVNRVTFWYNASARQYVSGGLNHCAFRLRVVNDQTGAVTYIGHASWGFGIMRQNDATHSWWQYNQSVVIYPAWSDTGNAGNLQPGYSYTFYLQCRDIYDNEMYIGAEAGGTFVGYSPVQGIIWVS